jgi:hypothetical protein
LVFVTLMSPPGRKRYGENLHQCIGVGLKCANF